MVIIIADIYADSELEKCDMGRKLCYVLHIVLELGYFIYYAYSVYFFTFKFPINAKNPQLINHLCDKDNNVNITGENLRVEEER